MVPPSWLIMLLLLGGAIGLIWWIVNRINGIDPLDID